MSVDDLLAEFGGSEILGTPGVIKDALSQRKSDSDLLSLKITYELLAPE